MNKMVKRWFILLIASGLTLIACQPVRSTSSAASSTNAQAAYKTITVADLQEMLKQKDFLLVNVHIPFEGNLPGTDLSIPYNEIDKHLDQLPDKNSKVVLYCLSGGMSATAADVLSGLGYTNIYDLKGGMLAWEAAGFKLADQ